MNKETLRMQMLAGIITESQYKEKLDENKTAEAWLVDDENGRPIVTGFSDIRYAKEDRDNGMDHFASPRPLFVTLKDLKNYLDKRFGGDVDVEQYKYIK